MNQKKNGYIPHLWEALGFSRSWRKRDREMKESEFFFLPIGKRREPNYSDEIIKRWINEGESK